MERASVKCGAGMANALNVTCNEAESPSSRGSSDGVKSWAEAAPAADEPSAIIDRHLSMRPRIVAMASGGAATAKSARKRSRMKFLMRSMASVTVG